MKLDKIDIKILCALQRNGRISNVELAEVVHLSATPCLLDHGANVTLDLPFEAVCRAVPKPVIVAGSVDRPDQIETIRKSGPAGFTVGTSALDGRFPAEGPAREFQLRAISACRKGHQESMPLSRNS